MPTAWQMNQFPGEFRSKIRVLHDGIDTDYFSPRQNGKLILPDMKLDLSEAKEIVTYVDRAWNPIGDTLNSWKPYLCSRNEGKNVTLSLSAKTVLLTAPFIQRKTYKQAMLEQYDFDLSRLHFTGRLPIPGIFKCYEHHPHTFILPVRLSCPGPCWKPCLRAAS
jgi:hypothetical protein